MGMTGTGLGMPGMGLGPMGMGMFGLGMPGMGMTGMGMGMGMSGMGMQGMGMGMQGMGQSTAPLGTSVAGMWGMSGVTPLPPRDTAWIAYRTAIHHPGDLSGIVPCTGCGAIVDLCTFGGRCQYMQAGLWPDDLGLHTTTNRPAEALYFPQGPLLCGRSASGNPAGCVDAPGEWNLRSGMPSASGSTGR